MGIFDKLLMTEEEKEQSRQLNQISYINALNTHNWELQQKVMALTAQNAQRQSQEELGLFLIKIGDRGYYVCEAVWKEIETLRKALKPFAYYASQIPDDVSDTASASGTVGDLRRAAAAIRESGK